jgi:Protein of unknown function (DUF2752)
VDHINRDRLTASAVVALAAGGLSVVYLLDPSSSELYPPCPFLALTGFYCPGCGTLRALHQLTLGHPVAALDLNPLMVLLLPFVAYFFASHAMLALTGRPLRKFFVRAELIWALLFVVLVYWLLRNIPAYPLTLLAP